MYAVTLSTSLRAVTLLTSLLRSAVAITITTITTITTTTAITPITTTHRRKTEFRWNRPTRGQREEPLATTYTQFQRPIIIGAR